MSNISDLKNGNNQNVGINVDLINGTSSEDENKRVPMGSKTIPSQKKRKQVNIKDIVQDEPTEDTARARREMHEKRNDEQELAKSILEGENSMFSTYLKEKHEEMRERLAEFDEERARLIREGKLDPKDIKDEDFHIEDLESAPTQAGNIVRGEDLDIDLTGGDDTEEDTMEDKPIVVDEIDDEIDLNDEFAEVEAEETEIVPEVEIEENKEEQKIETEYTEKVVKKKEVKKEEKKDESVSAADMDIDFSTDKTFNFTKKDEEEEEDDDDVADDDTIDKIKELATERLKPAFKKLDISNFTVTAKKASSSASKIITDNTIPVVKWVLPIQDQVVFMRQFSGQELQRMSEDIQEDSVTSTRHAYRMIYDHIMNDGKPGKFDKWLRCTPEADLEHYFFAIFVASYNHSNYLPINCTNRQCSDRTFMTDDIPVLEMVKFSSEKMKKKFNELYKSEKVVNNEGAVYMVARVPITQNLAIDFKEPTLHDQLVKQNIANDRRFVDNNSSVFEIIQYIDEIYLIDWDNGDLNPIEYKKSKKNVVLNDVEEYRQKITKYTNIFGTLDSDEFSSIRAITNSIQNHTGDNQEMMHYITPSVTCPNCGTVVEEVETNAVQLVFTRYQLGALVNTTLK